MQQTPLYDLHRSLGARLVPFAGYQMPLHYAPGILNEHRHVRDAAGLFDVSHMGQIRVAGAGAGGGLERLTPCDVIGLQPGQQRYALLTNPSGGILDDLMIARAAVDDDGGGAGEAGDDYWLIVNAACKQRDLEHLQQRLGAAPDCVVEAHFPRALLALQGPAAAAALAALAPAAAEVAASLVFMQTATLRLDGIDQPLLISRSGYTGEDGFEISVAAASAVTLAERLLAQPDVEPIGLGARDSLRLEAGLCLYGHDIDDTTTPVEAGLSWAIGKTRRRGGARAGGFPGADTILEQLQDRQRVARARVGLRVHGKAPLREGAELFDDGAPVGRVTSGGFAPSLGEPVAMAYIDAGRAAPGRELTATLRGRELTATITRMPFVEPHYRR